MYGPRGERRLTELELAVAPRLRGLGAGADRQRRPRAVPARRVRRGARRAAPGRVARDRRRRRRRVAARDGAGRRRRGSLARARRRHLGGARRPPPLHPLEGDGVGRRSTGRSARPSRFGLDAPVERWRRCATRSTPRCSSTASTTAASFVQSYGSNALDASLLIVPLVGFLPPDDQRVVATVEAIERELTEDGFVRRYHPDRRPTTASPGGEGAFLLCSFWMADGLALHRAAATRRAERVRAAARPAQRRRPARRAVRPGRRSGMLGNFPQAFSHVVARRHRARPAQRPQGGVRTRQRAA